jgi:hypothetical protein
MGRVDAEHVLLDPGFKLGDLRGRGSGLFGRRHQLGPDVSQNRLPQWTILSSRNVGAINWGLVAGKSNTKYAWNTPIDDGAEPVEWFHEVFRKDGTPYRQDEVNLIKKLNVEP